MTAISTIAQLHQVYSTGRTRSVRWRRGQLAALQALLEDHTSAIEAALAADLGNNAFEAWVSEVGPVLAEIAVLRQHLAAWNTPQRVRTPLAFWPAKSAVQHTPRGTVLIIAPWNYPLQLSLSPLAGAIAAGNTVVLKPSEVSTAVTALLAELIPQYLDPHAIRVVTGGPDIVHELIDAKPDYVFFTGSSRVGSIIAQACATHLIGYTLELGGQSPVYVHCDADVQVAARRLVWGKFLNAGQTCVAPNHLYVHQDVADELIEALAVEVSRQFGPDPATNGDYPRLITNEHVSSLAQLLHDSQATVVTGGTSNPAERYMAPTIVTDVTETDALMSRELFGPILPIITVTDINDALHRIGQRDHALSCYLFTGSETVKEYFLQRVVAGGIGVNIPVLHVGNPHLPFGGVGASGTGQYHGRWSLETFSHQRAVLEKPTRPDTMKLISHPVPALVNWAVRRLMTAGLATERRTARTLRRDANR